MRLAALDGWRGLCAMLVAVYHFNTATDFSFSTFIRNSFLFVEFFFVLSGLVICHAYANRIHNVADWWAYIIKRTGRLWPLHIVLLLAMIPIAIAESVVAGGSEDGRFTISAFIANIFLVHALGLFETETWNFVSWSISVEFYTCILFGLVCVFSRPKLWLYALISLAGALVVWQYSNLEDTYSWALFRGIYSFFLGCCMYLLFIRVQERWGSPFKGGFATLVELAALGSVVWFLIWGVNHSNMILAPCLFAMVVWVYAFEAGQVSTLLKTSLIQNLGLYSYSIYLIHGVLVTSVKGGLFAVEKLFGVSVLADFEGIKIIDFGSTIANLGATAGFVVFLYIISKYSYHHIESPWRHRIAAWASKS